MESDLSLPIVHEEQQSYRKSNGTKISIICSFVFLLHIFAIDSYRFVLGETRRISDELHVGHLVSWSVHLV